MRSPSIDEVLQSDFRLEQFRPHQREIIEDVLAGRDAVCVMPTGAGKSLCFQLPAVVLGGLTVVISPLISLMADQVKHLKTLGVPAAYLNTSQSADEKRDVLNKLARGARGLLYIAPEGLAAPYFQRLVPTLKARLLVIDEAHCISHWGHDFRPEYRRIAELRQQLGSPVTMALTATATPQVRADIVTALGLKSPRMHVTGFDRPNLTYSCHSMKSEADKDAALLRYLSKQRGSGIIYCSTRKLVEQLAARLQAQFPQRSVCEYHAGLGQNVRKASQEKFMAAPDSIVVATNAFGMGINKPGTRFVMHYNLPGSIEAYYQEAGRAGRDGAPAECILYFGMRDLMTQKFFIKNLGDNNEALSAAEIARLQRLAQRKLDLMYNYATRHHCRRRQILDYFGEPSQVTGCGCDVCAGGPQQQHSERSASAPWIKDTQAVNKSYPPLSTRSPEQPRAPRLLKAEFSDAPLDAAAELRLSALKQVRLQLAKENGVPAFFILNKKTLCEVARTAPQSRPELIAIKGVGAIKAEKFGAALLAAVTLPVQEHVLKVPLQEGLGANPLPANVSRPVTPVQLIEGPILDPAALARFEKLKKIRAQLATGSKWPPYFILNDTALREVAVSAPGSISAMAALKSVGEQKALKWGSALLAALVGE